MIVWVLIRTLSTKLPSTAWGEGSMTLILGIFRSELDARTLAIAENNRKELLDAVKNVGCTVNHDVYPIEVQDHL